MTFLPISCNDFLQILEPQPPVTIREYPGLYWDRFTFFCSGCKFGCNRPIINRPIMKSTLLGAQSPLSFVAQLPIEEFLWTFIPRNFHASATNSVSLVKTVNNEGHFISFVSRLPFDVFS